jgi:hypothetical protein
MAQASPMPPERSIGKVQFQRATVAIDSLFGANDPVGAKYAKASVNAGCCSKYYDDGKKGMSSKRSAAHRRKLRFESSHQRHYRGMGAMNKTQNVKTVWSDPSDRMMTQSEMALPVGHAKSGGRRGAICVIQYLIVFHRNILIIFSLTTA